MWPIAQAVFLVILLEYGAGQGSNDGYTDENRPYEFGFVIEGEQHRYEKKDEKGIIMGEFGFITADGVYHLTVYATDEDGNFRILKTRNTKIGLPMTTTSTTTSTRPALRKQDGLRGCSGCLIPTTSSTPLSSNSPKSPIQQNNGPGIFNKPYSENEQHGRFGGQGNLQGGVSPPGGQPVFDSPANRPVNVKNLSPDNRSKIQAQPKSDGFTQGGIGFKSPPNVLQETPDINRKPYPSKGFVQQTNGIPAPSPKPTQTLTKTEEKMLDFLARLYKFNYTLTYHGHEEEGDIAGNKRGSYFNNGRDGYQRKVVYIANEFGYQPMVMLLKLNADETPNEFTEKELTQLKGSEFKWFFDKIKN